MFTCARARNTCTNKTVTKIYEILYSVVLALSSTTIQMPLAETCIVGRLRLEMYHYVREPTSELPYFNFLQINDFKKQLDAFQTEHFFPTRAQVAAFSTTSRNNWTHFKQNIFFLLARRWPHSSPEIRKRYQEIAKASC